MSHTYKKNYLKQVIFRIDFAEIELREFAQYGKSLESYFDQHKELQGKQADFELNVASGELIDLSKEIKIWQFVNTKSGNKFEVGPAHCLLEYFSYEDSKSLKSDIDTFCRPLLDEYDIRLVNRIGLRYINQLEIPAVKKIGDWNSYINSSLLAPSEFLREKGKIQTRILSQMDLKSDNYSTTFKHGIWNEKYPNPITNNPYILDIDSFTRFPVEIDKQSLLTFVDSLNVEAEEIFELSITNKLREDMDK